VPTLNLDNLTSPSIILDLGEYILRPQRPTDVSARYACLSDPEVTRLTSYEIESESQVAEMMDAEIAGYAPKTSYRWAIARKDTDVLIGTCGYPWWYTGYSITEIGYELSRSYWGTGLMTRAVQACVKWGFETLEANRIQATVMVNNFGSARVLEKNGFLLEGTMREFKICHGQPCNYWMFALLRKDYKHNQ
jgi:ribosomal-protein-alanine N-acetyltransferase